MTGRRGVGAAAVVAALAVGGTVAASVALERAGAPADRGAPAGPERSGHATATDGVLAPAPQANPEYDGRFAFVRLRFGGSDLRGGFGFRRGREPLWAHDYPRAETNFLKILDETTYVGTNLDGRVILDLDDPELFRYPVAYIVEVGYWRPSDAEVAALRSWLLKGGFLIVDDFRGSDLGNFETQLRRVLPEARLQPVENGHRIFDSFFHIEDPLALAPPTFGQFAPVYLGIYEDNDPDRRLMVMVNYNQDIAEYWEYSDYGYYPIDLANDAYKFGVNYIIYAYTH